MRVLKYATGGEQKLSSWHYQPRAREEGNAFQPARSSPAHLPHLCNRFSQGGVLQAPPPPRFCSRRASSRPQRLQPLEEATLRPCAEGLSFNPFVVALCPSPPLLMFRQVLLGRLPPRMLPLVAALLLQKDRKETGFYHWRVMWSLGAGERRLSPSRTSAAGRSRESAAPLIKATGSEQTSLAERPAEAKGTRRPSCRRGNCSQPRRSVRPSSLFCTTVQGAGSPSGRSDSGSC